MDGIVIIDKPKGHTSREIVDIVGKNYKTRKVGHTGTLDPLATGVLPILVGDATKLSKYLIEHDKIYVAKVVLGERRTTGDLEGEVVETIDTDISKIETSEIEDVLKSFLGESKQVPSIYSAIKVNGKKLYEYAREGKEVEVPERTIFIKNIRLLNINNDENSFEYFCFFFVYYLINYSWVAFCFVIIFITWRKQL